MTVIWPDEPLLEQLCRERYGRLVAMATMLLGSSTGADDLVQEALVAVFRKRRKIASLPAAEGYVRRAIATKYIDGARKRTKEADSLRRHASLATTVVVEQPPTGETVDVESLLAGLAPRVRACIALRFLDDMSVAETANALNLSEGAVKRYVSDGLSALNVALGSEAEFDDALRAPVIPTRRTDA